MSGSRAGRATGRNASAPAKREAPAAPPSKAAAATRSLPSLPFWGALCFFTSGAAGLLYESIWSKQLSYVLGSSLHAVATVIGAFLAGLAIGARVLGVPLARRGNGVRIYALLEIGVAVLGLLSLPLLRAVEPLVGLMYRGLGGEGPAFAVARFALLFALLVPPAALMGATLPVLVARFERELVGPMLARLYAVNTFGAVAGSILGGFFLMPAIGLSGTAAVAAALNLAAAAIAWFGSAKSPTRDSAAQPVLITSEIAAPLTAPLLPGPRLGFTVLFGVSGFAALAFQIAWVRLFGLVFGSSVYSFAAVLGIYLLGIALGSAAIARFMNRAVSLAWFGWLQLGLALIAAVQLHTFSRLPEWVYGLGERAGASWGALFAGEVGLVALLLLAPCALLGTGFPVAARLLQRSDGGHAAGFAYAVNTAGTIAGSVVAGFFMVPTWGVQGTQLAALVLSFVVGITCLAMSSKGSEFRSSQLALALAALFLTGGLATFAPEWDPALMSAGLFRPTQASRIAQAASMAGASPAGATVWNASRRENVLFYREGINGSVLVATDTTGERWLRLGGKIDASTGDMETQVLAGMLPTALAKPNARTLVIGLGSGFSAAAVLAAGSGPTDIVELEPGVVEGSRFFHPPGRHPLDDPRARLIMGDARTVLAHGDGLYDSIASEPSNPWIVGVNNLFTVDFYQRVKTRLAPDGVFCQWMQLYELSPATFSTMVASFLEVFPNGHLFAVWRSVDVFLMAVPEGRRFDLERLTNSPAALDMLKRARVTSAEALAAYYAGPLSLLSPVAQGAPLNRDDRPLVEYRAPQDLVAIGRSSPIAHAEVRALVPFAEAMPEPLFAAWDKSRWFEARVRGLMEQGEEARAVRAVRGIHAAGITELATRLGVELERAQRQAKAMEQIGLAQELLTAGDNNQARQAIERATQIDPDNGLVWVNLAEFHRSTGDLNAAEQALSRARQSPQANVQAEAAVVAGSIELGRSRPEAATERFLEAQRLNPKLGKAYVLEAQSRWSQRDAEGSKQALRRGLGQLPGDAEITTMLANISGQR